VSDVFSIYRKCYELLKLLSLVERLSLFSQQNLLGRKRTPMSTSFVSFPPIPHVVDVLSVTLVSPTTSTLNFLSSLV